MMKTKFLLLASLLLASFSCKKDQPLTAPQAGLISYFNFDDNLKDQKGYTTDGVKTGTPPYIAGVKGKAVSFNGIDQKIVFSPKISLINNSFTVSLWVKDETDDGSKFFMTGNGFYISTSANNITFSMNTQGNTLAVLGPNSLNQWTHIVSIYDGINMSIYINGVLANSKNNPGSIAGFDSGFSLGGHQATYWTGSIDQLYIYNRALSQAEVTQLYNLK